MHVALPQTPSSNKLGLLLRKGRGKEGEEKGSRGGAGEEGGTPCVSLNFSLNNLWRGKHREQK